VQGQSTVRPGKQDWLMSNGLKWNAMTNVSGDIAETSVTDFFTLWKFGRVSGSTNVWTRPCLKWSGPEPWTWWKL